jgi:hypothetical protein
MFEVDMKRLFCLLFLVLSGCSLLHIQTEPVEKPKLEIKLPDPLALGNINFLVVTRENAESKFVELEKKGMKPVMFSISGTDYKILAVNMQQIQNYIEQLQEIIKQYQLYYEGSPVPAAE